MIESSLDSSFLFRLKALGMLSIAMSFNLALSFVSLLVVVLSQPAFVLRRFFLIVFKFLSFVSLFVVMLFQPAFVLRRFFLIVFKVLSFVSLFCSPFFAQAVKISFPDEELATESVLPMVDVPSMILNRNISLKYRFELNVSFGFGLDEPFYFPYYGMGLLSFHISEVHSISLSGVYYPPGLSSAGKRLQKDYDFDPSKAPYPQMSAFLNYQYSPFYGKISLSKKLNLNLSIYGFTGLGVMVSNQNDRFPAVNLGLGQKLYFTRWFGLRGDLGVHGYYGPAVAKLDLSSKNLKFSELQSHQKRVNVNVLASLGMIFLL